MPPSLDPPRLRVVLTTEALPPIYGWRTLEGTYVGAATSEAERLAVLARQGHTVVTSDGKPLAVEAPAPPTLAPVTAEAIREAGMVPVSFAEARSPNGPIRKEVLASPAFPDLQKIVRIGPGEDRATEYQVADQKVPANPAAIVAALNALGHARKPPMEQRR